MPKPLSKPFIWLNRVSQRHRNHKLVSSIFALFVSSPAYAATSSRPPHARDPSNLVPFTISSQIFSPLLSPTPPQQHCGGRLALADPPTVKCQRDSRLPTGRRASHHKWHQHEAIPSLYDLNDFLYCVCVWYQSGSKDRIRYPAAGEAVPTPAYPGLPCGTLCGGFTT